MRRSMTLTLLLLLVTVSPVMAIEPVFIFLDGPSVPPLLEKLGDRQTVDKNELSKLIETLAPKPEPLVTAEAPIASSLIRSARYRGNVSGDAARFTATFEVFLYEDGPIQFKPPLAGMAPIGATVDGKLTNLFLPGATHLDHEAIEEAWLPLSGVGSHTVSIIFLAPVSRFGELATVSIPTPRVAMGSLALTVDEVDADIDVVPSTAMSISHEKEQTKVQCGLLVHSGVFIRWSSKTERATEEPTTAAIEEEPLLFDSTVLASATVHDCWLSVDHRFHYEIKRGKLQALTIELPPDCEVLSVTGKNIQRWHTDQQQLQIYLETRFDESYDLVVKTASPLPPEEESKEGAVAVSITLSGARTTGANTEKGYLAISLDDEGEPLPGTPRAITRVDPREIKPPIATDQIALAYKFIEANWQLPFHVLRRRRVETTTLRIEECKTELRLTVTGAALAKQTWQVVNDGMQFLEVTLPDTAGLMSCFVDGAPRAVGSGADTKVVKIPLVKSKGTPGQLRPFPVEVTYATWLPTLGYSGEVDVTLATVDHVVRQTHSRVTGPRQYRFIPCGGSMRSLTPSALSRWIIGFERAMATFSCDPTRTYLNRAAPRMGRQMEVMQQAPRPSMQRAGRAMARPHRPRRRRLARDKSLKKLDGASFAVGGEMADDEEMAEPYADADMPAPEEARSPVSATVPSGGSGLWGIGSKEAKREEEDRRNFIATVRRSSARKGNLPVQVKISGGRSDVVPLSFAQELVSPHMGRQQLRLSYIRTSFLLCMDWLSLLVGSGLFLVIFASTDAPRRLMVAGAILVLLALVNAVFMHYVPRADQLTYLLVALPVAVFLHCLRWCESFVSSIIAWRRQRRQAYAATAAANSGGEAASTASTSSEAASTAQSKTAPTGKTDPVSVPKAEATPDTPPKEK